MGDPSVIHRSLLSPAVCSEIMALLLAIMFSHVVRCQDGKGVVEQGRHRADAGPLTWRMRTTTTRRTWTLSDQLNLPNGQCRKDRPSRSWCSATTTTTTVTWTSFWKTAAKVSLPPEAINDLQEKKARGRVLIRLCVPHSFLTFTDQSTCRVIYNRY